MICYAAKSYLPTHDTFHKTARYALHIFADAFHAGRVEAKSIASLCPYSCSGRIPRRMCRGKAVRLADVLGARETHSTQDVSR